MKKILVCLLVLACVMPLCMAEEYQLEQVVVLSRHNIRSPLSNADSLLGRITPHTWFDWTSDSSELSMRGGVLETIMGQYFQKYLVQQGLIPKNWIPEDGEARFYANSLQRTITSARYFASGMLPLANAEVEYHCDINTMDAVFIPQITFLSDAFEEQVREELAASDFTVGISDNFALLEEVLDFADSAYAKENSTEHIAPDDAKLVFSMYAEPKIVGGLSTACSGSDALVLQYYEEEDDAKAAFGHVLTEEEWASLAHITDTYGKFLVGTRSVAVNVAHPLLMELRGELTEAGRKFSFLCGHDSNLCSVLTALRAEEYELPNSLLQVAPIGSKLTIEKWKNAQGEEYVTVSMIYQSTEQLRNCTMLDLNTPPMCVRLQFKGLERNADGMYRLEDILNRFDEAIAAYDELPRDAEDAEEAA